MVATRDESSTVLESTIDGLLSTSTSHSHEIIVVDDGSRIPLSLEQPAVVSCDTTLPSACPSPGGTGSPSPVETFWSGWMPT